MELHSAIAYLKPQKHYFEWVDAILVWLVALNKIHIYKSTLCPVVFCLTQTNRQKPTRYIAFSHQVHPFSSFPSNILSSITNQPFTANHGKYLKSTNINMGNTCNEHGIIYPLINSISVFTWFSLLSMWRFRLMPL